MYLSVTHWSVGVVEPIPLHTLGKFSHGIFWLWTSGNHADEQCEMHSQHVHCHQQETSGTMMCSLIYISIYSGNSFRVFQSLSLLSAQLELLCGCQTTCRCTNGEVAPKGSGSPHCRLPHLGCNHTLYRQTSCCVEHGLFGCQYLGRCLNTLPDDPGLGEKKHQPLDLDYRACPTYPICFGDCQHPS